MHIYCSREYVYGNDAKLIWIINNIIDNDNIYFLCDRERRIKNAYVYMAGKIKRSGSDN